MGVAALIALVLLRGVKSVVSSFEGGAFGDDGPVPETVVTES